MLEDTYRTPVAKLALALTSAQQAKAIEVATAGIGEDLHLNLLAWREHRIEAAVQLVEEPESRNERLGAIAKAAHILRAGFGAEALTLVTEGYVDLAQRAEVPTAALASLFASGDLAVVECLAATHVEDGVLHFAAAPYRYEVGRTVNFDDPILHLDETPVGTFPALFAQVLAEVPVARRPDDSRHFLDELGVGLATFGFTLVHGPTT